jgi:hypothetical protein
MSMVETRPDATRPETDQPETGKEAYSYWSLSKCKKAYTEYLGSKSEEISEQKSSRAYRHGAQWTVDQVEKFNARKQPVVTYNRIGRKIDAIVGLLEKLKQDPKGSPRNPRVTDEMSAELATSTVRYVVESDLREDKFPFAIEMGAVDGIGGIEMTLEPADDEHKQGGQEYDIGFALVRTDSFFYDPCSYDHDFADARYMGQGKWLDLEDAKKLAPEDKKDLVSTGPNGSDLTSSPDRDKHWFDVGSDYKRVRVVEIWYRHEDGWCWCLFTGGVKLQEGRGYFYDHRGRQICKYIMFSAFVDHDGDRYSFVRALRSSQDEINQRRSKGLHELNSRRIKAEDGAFTDLEVARREAVRPDGVVIYNKGFEMEFDDAARIANVEGQLKFLEDAKNEIENFGPSPALIGQGLEYKSGRAINLLQQAGIAELGPFVINVKNWKLRVYRAIWAAIQRYWTAERWIEVTDAEGLPQAIQLNGIGIDPQTGFPRMVNLVGKLDVNFKLDEGPDEVNMMADAYDTLIALTAQGANIPPQILLELAPLQGSVKRKLLSILEKKDPIQEAAKQAALAGEQAKVQKTQSEAQLNIAKAREAQQGGAHGLIERQMDMQMSQQEHQAKMAQEAVKMQGIQVKAQAEREKTHISMAGEFAKLRSLKEKGNLDMQVAHFKANQQARHAETMNAIKAKQAATKPTGAPSGR